MTEYRIEKTPDGYIAQMKVKFFFWTWWNPILFNMKSHFSDLNLLKQELNTFILNRQPKVIVQFKTPEEIVYTTQTQY